MHDAARKYRRAVILLDRFGLNRLAAWVCKWTLRRCPEHRGEFLVLLAQFTAEAGHRDSAVEALELCASEHPLEADGLLGLAGIHREKQGRLDEAARYYDRALSTAADASEEFRADLRTRLHRCRAAP